MAEEVLSKLRNSRRLNLESLSTRLRRHTEFLAKCPRPSGSEHHRAAAAYIQSHLERHGFEVQEVALETAGAASQGKNLLARKPQEQVERTQLPLVIVAAHYDSSAGSPGADDNASAVAALLEIAGFLAATPADGHPRCRLQLAAYDLEELGLAGSTWHSESLAREGTEVAGMICLDMLAYTDSRPGTQAVPSRLSLASDVQIRTTADFISVCGNDASRPLLDEVAAALGEVAQLEVQTVCVAGVGERVPELRYSDHSSFWDRSFPAVMISDTGYFRNPHYHRASDRPETLDYLFVARVTVGTCRAVGRLLGLSPASRVTAERAWESLAG